MLYKIEIEQVVEGLEILETDSRCDKNINNLTKTNDAIKKALKFIRKVFCTRFIKSHTRTYSTDQLIC